MVVLALVAAQAAAVHPGVCVPSELACPTCRIELHLQVSIGGASDPVGLANVSKVAADRRGHFIVAPAGYGNSAAVYDSTGRFLRLIEGGGGGPGEFQSPIRHIAIGRADTIHLFTNYRESVFGPGGDALVRASRIPLPIRHVAPLPDGSLIIQYLPIGARPTHDPLHRIDEDRQQVVSFGASDADGPHLLPDETVRPIALARDARSIWIARTNTYQLERWSLGGSRETSVSRDAEWFTPWHAQPPGAPFEARPLARLMAIHEDPKGFLWTVTYVAAERWRRSDIRPEGDIRQLDVLPSDLYDTVIEVINPSTGQVLARRQLRGAFAGFAGDRLLYRTRYTAEGDLALDVWFVTVNTH